MNKILYSNNYTILTQYVSKCYNYIGPDNSFEIDYFDDPIEFNEEALMEIIDNFNKYPHIIYTDINYCYKFNNLKNSFKNLYTFNGLDLLSDNISIKILFRECGNYLYGNTDDGYIYYITNDINCDIFWYDINNYTYTVFLDKEKKKSINIDFDFHFNHNKLKPSEYLTIKNNIDSLDTKIKVLYDDFNHARNDINKKNNEVSTHNIINTFFFSEDYNLKDQKLINNNINLTVETIISNYNGFEYQYYKELNEYKQKKKAIINFVNKIKDLIWPNNQKNNKIYDTLKIRYFGKYLFKPIINEIFADGSYKLFLPYSEYPYMYNNYELYNFYRKNITNEIKDLLVKIKILKEKKFNVIKKNNYNIYWKTFPHEKKIYPIINNIIDFKLTLYFDENDIAILKKKIEK
jgi:hypothetical protein